MKRMHAFRRLVEIQTVELPSTLTSRLQQVKRALAPMAAYEIGQWLEIGHQDMGALSDPHILAVLSRTIPVVEDTWQMLQEAAVVASRVGQQDLTEAVGLTDNTVLQFKEVALAAITAPQTNHQAIVAIIRERLPRLSTKAKTIRTAGVALSNALSETSARTAGLLATFQGLIDKTSDPEIAWDTVKITANPILANLCQSTTGFNFALHSVSTELRDLL